MSENGTDKTGSCLMRLDLSNVIREKAKEKGIEEPITINIGNFNEENQQLRVRVTGVQRSMKTENGGVAMTESDTYRTYSCKKCANGTVTQYPDRSACDSCGWTVRYMDAGIDK